MAHNKFIRKTLIMRISTYSMETNKNYDHDNIYSKIKKNKKSDLK